MCLHTCTHTHTHTHTHSHTHTVTHNTTKAGPVRYKIFQFTAQKPYTYNIFSARVYKEEGEYTNTFGKLT